MGTINKEGKSFFEIAPRELRDLIYDATFHHEVKSGAVTSIFEARCLHLRLVSRQFKDEFDKRKPKHKKLVVCFDADLAHLRSPRLSAFVPSLAARCISVEVRYLAHNFQLFDGCRQRSENFSAFSVLCMQLAEGMVNLRNFKILLIWDSVRTLETFAATCQHTATKHTCVSTSLRRILSAENYIARRTPGASNKSWVFRNFRLLHRGLASIGPPGGFDFDVPRIKLLKKPVVLGIWTDHYNQFLVRGEGIRDRRMVEVAIEAKKAVARKRPEGS
jgi:hypothetical protein